MLFLITRLTPVCNIKLYCLEKTGFGLKTCLNGGINIYREVKQRQNWKTKISANEKIGFSKKPFCWFLQSPCLLRKELLLEDNACSQEEGAFKS